MHVINITVRNKVAVNPAQDRYICGNSDFVVHFDFDSEWDAFETKTARFIKEDGTYVDQIFSGNDCPVPVISDTYKIMVGVFAGNLSTTTAAYVPCKKSILCGGGVPAAPAEDVYNQIMARLDSVPPKTEDPHMQIVTDKDGNTAWVERLAWKEVTTEKGYAYVYQDAEMTAEDGQYLLPTQPVASPVAGETYTIVIDGTEYTSKCVDASVLTDGLESYVFGNTAAMGDNLPIENPDPDAKYIIVLMPGGPDGFYGVLMFDGSVYSPALTIRSTEEVETTTTNIKKVDRELLDVPTPDMEAGVGEDGYIANRPCWVYETPEGRIRWDGVTEGKETLYWTFNGETSFLGYKVCPVAMNLHTFVNRLNSYTYTYPNNEDGSSAGTKRIIDTMEYVTNGLYAIKQYKTGKVLYYSFDADATEGSLATFSGSTGIYITPEFAAEVDAPCIDWIVGNIYEPLRKELLPPATTSSTDTNVYYWRWKPSSNSWQAVTIDQLKTDLALGADDGEEPEDTGPLIAEASAWLNPEETAWIVTEPNKSVAEIIAAFKAGRAVCAHVRTQGETMAGDFVVLPLVKVQGSTAVVFGASAPGLSARLDMVAGSEATFTMTE